MSRSIPEPTRPISRTRCAAPSARSCRSRLPAVSTSSMTASRGAPTTPRTSRIASPASMARARRRSAPASRTFPSSRRCSPTSPRRSSIGRPAPARSAGRISARSKTTSPRPRRRRPAPPAQDVFMTSPSPGQIARYLKNQYYPSDEAYLYALADVMAREYRAIVDAGFILQLDCPDLALSRHMVFAHLSLDDFRKVITTHVEALNHAVRDIPPERMRMHICWASTQGPHHKDVPLKDIVDIVLKGRPQAVSFPGANPRHGHEWKVWKDVKLPDGKIIIPGVIDFHLELRGAPGAGGGPAGAICARGRTRERHRRRRLRLRHLRRPIAGRFQDRMDEARVARRRSATGVAPVVVRRCVRDTRISNPRLDGAGIHSPSSRAGQRARHAASATGRD